MNAIAGNGNYANLLNSILEKFVKAHQVNLFLAGFSHLKPLCDTNSDEKHQCHHCDLLCKTEKQLKTHVKSKHADQHDSIGGETEKLKCSTCSATFKTSRMLR